MKTLNADTCPTCGINYQDFRTGMTFEEVYYIIYNRKHKRRHGVLGKWREIKIEMFNQHMKECKENEDFEEDANYFETVNDLYCESY
jgi:protein-arginine kinase activator protein McsA